MATIKRKKGVFVSLPFIYGNSATPLSKKNDQSGHTHKWTVYVRGANGEDISYYVKKVVFKLHESFENPSRAIEKPPYEVSETGWGEFEIQIKIHFQDPAEKPIQLSHLLKLFPSDDPAAYAEQKNNKVVSDHYDEVIFSEPNEHFYEVLHANMHTSVPLKRVAWHNYGKVLEQDEIKKIDEANSEVLRQIELYRQRIQRADKDVSILKTEVSALEKV